MTVVGLPRRDTPGGSLAIPLDDALVVSLFERARELGLCQALPSRIVSKEKLADLLGVKERTVKTWRSHGCPGHRVGREVMYDIEEVQRWLEQEAA